MLHTKKCQRVLVSHLKNSSSTTPAAVDDAPKPSNTVPVVVDDVLVMMMQ